MVMNAASSMHRDIARTLPLHLLKQVPPSRPRQSTRTLQGSQNVVLDASDVLRAVAMSSAIPSCLGPIQSLTDYEFHHISCCL
jgi:hypothetical protein